MKTLSVVLFALLLGLLGFAQSPQAFKYQAVVRDGTGGILTNRNVTFKISILQSSPTGTAVYTELHAKTTNSFGLVDLEIGNGTSPSGSFSGINWGANSYFVKIETDPAGGIAFQHMGTSQMLSVPYALYSKDVQNKNDADADPANEIQVLSKTGNIVSLSKGGGSFTDSVNDADADTTNEIQVLSIAGSKLSLGRNGGTVTIPGDNWGAQVVIPDATLTGNGTVLTPLGIAPQGALLGQFLGWNGLRWAPLPEGQRLALAGNNLSISGGNSVLLPQCPWGMSGNNIFYNAGNVAIGIKNPATYMHIGDPAGMIAPQVKIDNSFATPQGNTSVGFGNVALPLDYALGMDGVTGEFKLTKSATLLPSVQNDGITMIKTTRQGITSLNNQSRSRVYHSAGIILIFQMIPASIWQPVEFNMVTYDTQNEWQTAPIGSNPVGSFLPRGTSFFTVKEEGYYQVNARTEFMLSITDVPNKYIQKEGHVSIAIFVSLKGAQVTMYAQGNKLQGVHWMQMSGQNVELPDNLAPNVSDVVYLRPGDFLEIRAYQTILPLMPLMQGPSQTYVSVHKVS